MCFLMGLCVGGMLPVMFAIMAETIPARHRGWLMVLVGGDIAGAYILTSWLSAELVPGFSWRILWLLGAPTGALLIILNRWIPESPRFLLATGRTEEARAVMARYGAVAVTIHATTRFNGKPMSAESRRIRSAVTSVNPSARRLVGIHSWKPKVTRPTASPSSTTAAVIPVKGARHSSA